VDVLIDLFGQPEHLAAVVSPIVTGGRRAAVDLVEVPVKALAEHGERVAELRIVIDPS